ncbi:MAG: YbjN domain-containing protein [Flavobacteriales bacterium]|nr:YbjN domain-containing protein [Flavobacteriales bacterium]
MSIENYYNIVENCIRNLGVDPALCRGENPGQWSLVKGSAKVWIDVWYIEREQREYIQVMCPVMEVNTSNPQDLYKELLEINDKLFGCAFTIYNNWVWLKVIRECAGIDEAETSAMILRIGNYSDQYDDYLIGKYSTASAGNQAP